MNPIAKDSWRRVGSGHYATADGVVELRRFEDTGPRGGLIVEWYALRLGGGRVGPFAKKGDAVLVLSRRSWESLA